MVRASDCSGKLAIGDGGARQTATLQIRLMAVQDHVFERASIRRARWLAFGFSSDVRKAIEIWDLRSSKACGISRKLSNQRRFAHAFCLCGLSRKRTRL